MKNIIENARGGTDSESYGISRGQTIGLGVRDQPGGDGVERLQADLMRLGYLAEGQPDGDFGRRSVRALSRLQWYEKRKHLIEGSSPDDVASASYQGRFDGTCDIHTVVETR